MRKLGRPTDQRLAMLKTLTTDLFLHGKITTTEDRAKEVKAIADSIVSLAIKEKDNFEDMLKQSFAKVRLIKAIDSSYEDGKENDFLNMQKESYFNHIYNLRFFIDAEDLAKSYAPTLQSHLLKIGTKAQSSFLASKNEILIKIKVQAKKKIVHTDNPKLKDAHFATIEITLETKDNHLRSVAQNRIVVTNISPKDYQEATVKQGKFNRYIEQNGIVKTLVGN